MKVSLRKRDTGRGGWILLLIGLPFLAFGFGFGGFKVWPELSLWLDAKGWQQTRGELVSHRLTSHRDSEGSTTYEVLVEYRYEVNGRVFRSTRLGVHAGKDNIGDYHQQWDQRLKRSAAQETGLAVWYDPADPSQALLDRDLRWGLMLMQGAFALVFSVLGIGLVLAGVFSKKADAEEGRSDDQDSSASTAPLGGVDLTFSNGQPIAPDQQHGHWFFWGFALFWNLISFPACLAAWDDIQRIREPEDFLLLLILMFPLVGLFLFWQALRLSVLHHRYGESRLRMDPFPGQAGGQVGGEIQLSRALPVGTECETRLECRRSWESRGSKGEQKISTQVLWQDDLTIRGRLQAGKTFIPFVFDVPEDLPPSQPKSSDWHHWNIHVAADIPGLDLALDFSVPVSQGRAGSQIKIPGRERQQQLMRSQQLAGVLNVEQRGDMLYMNSLYGREWGGSLFFALFGLVFLGIGIGLGFADMGSGMIAIPIKLLFCTAFGGMGLLIFLIGVLTPTTRLDTAIDEGMLHVKRSFLGRIIYRKSIPLEDINRLEAHRNGSQSSGGRTRNWYQLRIHYDGKRQVIAESIPGRVLADEALAFLRSKTLLP